MVAVGPLLQMKKGNTMQQFLQKALEILRKDFSELRCERARRGRPGPVPETYGVAGSPGGRAACWARGS